MNDPIIDRANVTQVRKLKLLAAIAFITALVLGTLDNNLPSAAVDVFRAFLPSLRAAPVDASSSYIVFFGLVAVGAPIAAVYLAFEDPLQRRLTRGIKEGRSVRLRKAAFLYLVFLPFVILLFYWLLNLPASAYDPARSTWGARLVRSMAYSPLMTVVFGPIAAIGLWFMLYMCFVPVIGIFYKGKDNAN